MVRKQCMDALRGLPGLHRVDAVFGLVTFFADGQDAKRGDSFERVAGSRVHHADAKRDKVAGINNYYCHYECN